MLKLMRRDAGKGRVGRIVRVHRIRVVLGGVHNQTGRNRSMARGNNDEIIRIVVNSVTDLVLARNSRVNWICRRRGRIAGLPDTGDEAKRRSRPKTLSRRTMHEAPCFEPSRTRDTLQPECEEANTGWQWEDLRQWNSEASTREGGGEAQDGCCWK